jgi:RNA polymerase primary sigma factor
MLQASPRSELTLLAAVLAGDPEAAKRFLEAVSPTLWSVVVKLEGEGPQAEAAFLHVVSGLRANGYARLRAFDRRARLSTYLAIVARELLADRLVSDLIKAPREAWKRFERFFGADLRRRAAQRFPRGESAREDAYQEVCLRLIEDDYRRLRAYDGHGSFTGFVLTVADRILIDLVRKEAPRRRLPAAVARLSPLDRAVYAAVVWQGSPCDPAQLAMRMRGRLEPDPQPADILESIDRLTRLGPLTPSSPAADGATISIEAGEESGGALAVADPAADPEEELLLAEEERGRAGLLAIIKAEAAQLPTNERLYLQVLFSATEPLPAREIARKMQLPVEEIYRLKQRSQRWLAGLAARFEKSRGRPSIALEGRGAKPSRVDGP